MILKNSSRMILFLLMVFIAISFVSAEDVTAPETEIMSPSANSWQNQNFSAIFVYSEEEGGTGLDDGWCKYKVTSNGEITEHYKSAGSCSGYQETIEKLITIGEGFNCKHEGESICKIFIKAKDIQGNDAQKTNISLNIDWTAPNLIISNKKIRTNEKLNYNFSLNDAVSGIFNVSVNNENFNITNDYNLTNTTVLVAGTYNLAITAIDNAGNLATRNMVLTVLANNQKLADEENVTVEENETEIIFNSESLGVKEINIPKTINDNTQITLDFTSLLSNATGTPNVTIGSNDISLKRESTYNYIAEIPANTNISGSGWDGKLILPTIKPASDYSATGGSVGVVIELGSTVELVFDNAVKVILGGQAGKKAAWVRGTGALTEITTQCDSATNPTNIDPTTTKECYNDDGEDLIIWTYHFTSFASFTPITPVSGTSSQSSSSSTSCTTSWSCTEWSECANGFQTRECTSPEGFCTPTTAKPEESRSCALTQQPLSNINNAEPTSEDTKRFFSTITGAVIGGAGTPTGLTIIILIVVAGLIILIRKKTPKTKKDSKKK